MQKLAGLARLLTANDDDERNKLLSELQENARSAEKGILAIVQRQRHEFETELRKQRQQASAVAIRYTR